LPVGNWYDYIGESTIADAIMDRLSGNAHRFDLKGESLRMKILKFNLSSSCRSIILTFGSIYAGMVVQYTPE